MSDSCSVSKKVPGALSVAPARSAQTFVIVSGLGPTRTRSAQKSPVKEARLPETTSVSLPAPSSVTPVIIGAVASCQELGSPS